MRLGAVLTVDQQKPLDIEEVNQWIEREACKI